MYSSRMGEVGEIRKIIVINDKDEINISYFEKGSWESIYTISMSLEEAKLFVKAINEELRSEVKYVDFETARIHMREGNKAKYKNFICYIKNDFLYTEEDNIRCAFPDFSISNKEWILL